jgi:hypothetical protein
MRSMTTLITTAALLLHITLGCCAHHAHAARGCCNMPVAIHQCAGEELHCGHEHEHSTPAPSDERQPEKSCDELRCYFVAGGKWISPAHLAVHVASINAHSTGDAHTIGPAALRVRAHLAFQVLLI